MEKEIKKALISLGVFINILLTAACGHKTVDCDIEGKHIHKYRSDIGIERYISSEYDYVHNINDYTYYRTSDYVMLNEENEQLYSMISSNSLISIDGNKELLYNISDNLKDYYKFEYYYYETEYDTEIIINPDGSTTSHTTSKEVKKYDWTIDPHHKNLTGDKKAFTNVFYGYAIVKSDNGYRIIRGGPVDDIRILEEMGYKYIDRSIYSTIGRVDYLKKVGLYRHIKDSDLKPVYVIDGGEYVLYSEYIRKR